MLLNKIKLRLFPQLLRLAQIPRILKYKLLSNCKVFGKPNLLQPAQFVGNGEIYFEGIVTIGVFPSPYYFCGYAYIEARNLGAKVSIGNGTYVNNNFVAISDHKGITIGQNVFIGTCVEIFDSSFHGLNPDHRRISCPEDSLEVTIKDNVFIGSNVTILKGVTIGHNSVIANGSLVTKSIPSGVIAGGIPAKILRTL